MMVFNLHRRCRRPMLAGLFGALLLMGFSGSTVLAADEDDELVLPDQKIFRDVLRALGLRREGEVIDYRERSPLVLPPSRDLPPPETNAPAAKVSGWPDDPDLKRARQLKAERRKPKTYNLGDTVDDRPLTPGQLNLPTPAPRTASSAGGAAAGTAEDVARPSSPYELGSRSVFSWKALLGRQEDVATFTGEPPRSSLIDPPPGYRTPSPNQPYGLGIEKPKAADVNDRSIPVR